MRNGMGNVTVNTLRRIGLPALFAICSEVGVAQDQEAASGTFAPAGSPTSEVVRVDAGGACIIDLAQRYEIIGTLLGELQIDYRIFVNGPCGSPQGTFDEYWIARGTFTGTVEEGAASASFWYRADVAAGGDVSGTMRFAGDVVGELAVSGRFSEGRLSYQGTLQP